MLRRLLYAIIILSLAACSYNLTNPYPPNLQPAAIQAATTTPIATVVPPTPTPQQNLSVEPGTPVGVTSAGGSTPANPGRTTDAIPMTSEETLATPTPTPAPTLPSIDAGNASRLRPATIYPLFRRGLLNRAIWSPDGANIVVETSLGLQVLSVPDLAKRFSLPDTRPLYFINTGELLVRSARNLSLLNLLEGGATPLDVPLPEATSGEPGAFALSPDGANWVISADGVSLAVTQLDTRRVENVALKTQTGIPFRVLRICFSPNGERLFATLARTDGETEMAVVDTAAWQQIYTIYNVDSAPLFSPDSSRMLFESSEILNVAFTGDGKLWNNMALRIEKKLSETQTDILTAGAYGFLDGSSEVAVLYNDQLTDRQLPDNRWFPSTLMIFDTDTTTVTRYINGLPARITGFSFAPDGKTFLTTSEDGMLRLFDTVSEKELRASEPFDVDKTPQIRSDGRLVAYSLLENVALIDPASGDQLSTLGNYPEATHLEARFAGMDTLAIFVETPWRKFVDTYDVSSGSYLFRYSDLSGCGFNRNGSIMSCFDGVLRFFDMPSGRALLDNIPQGSGFEYATSDSGGRVAYCTVGGQFIYIYEVRLGSSPKLILTGDKSICGKLAFSPDESSLISSSGYIWSMKDGKLLKTFPSIAGSGPAAVSPDGSLLLVYPQIADLASGSIAADLQSVPDVQWAAFLRDGQRLLLQTKRGIEIWAVGS